MKQFTSILFIIFSINAYAQDFIKIEPAMFSGFIQQEVNAFKVEVIRVQREAFMDHWEKYMDKQTDNDIMRSENMIKLEKTVLKSISANPLNIYLFFEDMEDGSRMFVGVQDTVTGFIAASDSKYGLALTQLIRTETTKVFLDAKKNDLEAEEKHLKDLESDLDDVHKSQDKINKKILSLNRDIEKLKNDIEINKSVLSDVTDEVGNYRSQLNSLGANTPDETRKKVEKELKTQEKKRDKLSKSIDKDTRKIYDIQTEIRDLEYELDKLKSDEQNATDKVMAQREIITALRDELYKIDHR